MPYFTYDNKEVFYDIFGEGYPLILLHGNTVSSTLFKEHTGFFAQYFRVIVLDFPGHGRSGRLGRFRDDFWRYNGICTAELMKHLDIGEAYAIGTSGGAMAGLNVCTLYPGLFRKFIADSFFGDYISKEESDKIVPARTKALEKDTMARKYWEFHNGEDWEKVVRDDIDLIARVGEENLPVIYGNYEDITAEVLMTATTTDELVPEVEQRITKLCKQIPNCRPKFFDYGRHTFMITEVEDFQKIALEFFGV